MSEVPVYEGTDGVRLDEDTSRILAEAEARGESIEGAHRVSGDLPVTPPAQPTPPAPAAVPEKPAEQLKPKEEAPKPKEEVTPKPKEEEPKPKRAAEPEMVPIWVMKKAIREAEVGATERTRTELSGRFEQEKQQILADATKAGQDAAQHPGSTDIEVAVNRMAEKYPTMDKDAIRDLVTVSTQIAETRLTPKIEQASRPSLQQQISEDLAKFDEEFTDLSSKLSPEQQAHVQANKALIQEQAYSDDHAKTPLATLLLTFLHSTPPPAPAQPAKDTMEPTPSSPGVALGGSEEFENMTEERIAALSPEQREKYFEWSDRQNARPGFTGRR